MIMTSFVYNLFGNMDDVDSGCVYGYLAFFSANGASSSIKTEVDRMCLVTDYINPQVYAADALYLYFGANSG